MVLGAEIVGIDVDVDGGFDGGTGSTVSNGFSFVAADNVSGGFGAAGKFWI